MFCPAPETFVETGLNDPAVEDRAARRDKAGGLVVYSVQYCDSTTYVDLR